MNIVRRLAVCVIVAGGSSAQAVFAPMPQPKTVAAPKLQEAKVTPTIDRGVGDDVFVPPDQDFVVLRRGDENSHRI